MNPVLVFAAAISMAGSVAFAQDSAPRPVTAGTFVRAETDTYMANLVALGSLGGMRHERALASIEEQAIIRLNRDTLYSSGVFDLAAGPVTITMPSADPRRYVAVEVVSEDHYAIDVYHEGTHTLTADDVGTRYVALLMRVFVDPGDPEDVKAANAMQDSVKFEQAAPGSLELPNWDKSSLDKARQALLDLAALGDDVGTRRMGRKGEVDPVSHLIATAAGWGLNPETEAVYLGGFPANNDGKGVYRMVMRDMPVDAFWSLTVYNAGGYLEKNDLGAYSVNNVTGKKDADGAVTIQFGGCDGTVPNCLPTPAGWNYLIRLYRPHPEVLDGKWQAPPIEAG